MWLLGEELDHEWDEQLATINIQIHMEDRLQQLASRQSATEVLAAEVLRQTRELPSCRKLQ
jgi:hypothetical protein